MTNSPTTITISSDCSTIGDDAQRSDLEAYAENLGAHLSEHFEREVTVLIDSVSRTRAEDSEVERYVHELEQGDGWLAFLDTATTTYTVDGYTGSWDRASAGCLALGETYRTPSDSTPDGREIDGFRRALSVHGYDGEYSRTENGWDVWSIVRDPHSESCMAYGDRVEGGETDEDHDTGTVYSVSGAEVSVSWDSGVSTTQHYSVLRRTQR